MPIDNRQAILTKRASTCPDLGILGADAVEHAEEVSCRIKRLLDITGLRYESLLVCYCDTHLTACQGNVPSERHTTMANQKRRDQIATAALDLFDQRGYHGTGMEDIAKAVGMRASSLYNHYKSKQELLAEVTVSAMEETPTCQRRGARRGHGFRGKILATMRAHVIFHATTPSASAWSTTSSTISKNPTSPWSCSCARLCGTLDERRRRGQLQAENLKIACWALIDMGIGVATWFSPDGPYTAEELGDMYGQFALRQLT